MEIGILRHSCSHIMAKAVKQLWPDVKLGIGPAIEDGFYYDFDRKESFSEEELFLIANKMQEIINKNETFIKAEISKEDAIKLFTNKSEDYKVELIKALSDEKITVYNTGDDFSDLCRGPHIDTTGQVKAFKLLSVAGAYWHGIETGPMLQRIYGTCFETNEELQEYLKNLEEAQKRDHRKLGVQLKIFNIYHEDAGTGLIFYQPNGAIVRTVIEDYLKQEHIKKGYQIVITPHIMDADLWKRSGHYDYYFQNMYTIKIEGKDFVLKPMNCPGHILIYKSAIRSYRELPLRLFELGTVYRHEKTGVLHGLMRVRGFTQDDAHIFCTPQQLKDEITGIIDFVSQAMESFGFRDIAVELSTRPEKFIGTEDNWQKATCALEEALEEKQLKYEICPNEGAFYGPKIDIKIKDALKRKWQCATIQCDFALPQRFNLKYIDSHGNEQQPIMLHRVILGSLERFLGVLLEHYSGALPVWLSPIQVIILPINNTFEKWVDRVNDRLRQDSIRTEVDARTITLDKKIREAEIKKIPYIFVIGEREVNSNSVSVRKRKEGNQGSIELEEILRRINKDVRNKIV